MPAKLKDIAEELGLSVSTISRVVNNRDRVDPETRFRVLTALDNYNYKPNEVARSLRLQTTKTIAVVVPDIANNYYAAIIKGAQAVSRSRGYSVVVFNSDENIETEQEVLSQLPQHQIEGLILASVDENSDTVKRHRKQGLKVVFIDNVPPSTQKCDTVSIDNVSAARALTWLVINRGYSEIGFITGNMGLSSGRDRYAGFILALQEAKLQARDEWVLRGDFSAKSAYTCMTGLLALPKRPQAMIVSNNFMTYGAMKAISEAGLKIPADMALAAFDLVDESGLISPKITSINQPAYVIGESAAQILFARVENPRNKLYNNLMLEPTFVPGDSW